MGATVTSFEFPFDLNAPVIDLHPSLPKLTRWALLTAIVALIVWIVFFLLDQHKHNNHKKNHDKLKHRLHRLEARCDKHLPAAEKSSSS